MASSLENKFEDSTWTWFMTVHLQFKQWTHSHRFELTDGGLP